MGTIIIDTMAGGTLATEPKKLHPFFTAPRTTPHDPKATDLSAESLDTTGTQETSNKMGDAADEFPKRKRRKPAADEADDDWEDNKKPRRGRKKANQQGNSIVCHFLKTTSEDKELGISEQPSLGLEDIPLKESNKPGLQVPLGQPVVTDFETDTAVMDNQSHIQEQTVLENDIPPKRVLQLDRKAGTLGSPLKSNEPKHSKQAKPTEYITNNDKIPITKGRKQASMIAKIKYGTDDASKNRIANKIDQILKSKVSPISKRKRNITPPSQLKMIDEASKKETHPFFSGKPKNPNSTSILTASSATLAPGNSKPVSAPMRPKLFSSTPCSPKKSRVAATSIPFTQFGVKSLGLKTPGARLPAWPSKGMVHVRGDGDALTHPIPCIRESILPPRKSKGNTVHVVPIEMVLHDFATKLQISEAVDTVKNIDTENFLPPPRELRLPQKYFESGVELEKRVLRELRNAKHPALLPLRSSLSTSLSAFDKYQCESISWAQKYTPKSAVEVLQFGKEAFLLRDWLQALKVQSVDTGDGKPKPTKPAKKKRKKNKLDDFIVDSDGEADEMDEVSDPEEDWLSDRRGAKKTVIRAGDTLAKDSKSSARLRNTVVISGPHGCGKTSAVYAVAKELEFEIFEINPGSRRSGRDVLEKIGDMTRNHLVQHQQSDALTSAIDEEVVAEDIKSGKQATMATFFKPKSVPQPDQRKPAKKEVTVPLKPEQKRPVPKTQKQSLILLDEVDVLFEEDKQFWSTVIGLIAQSKRPFIMICNDENLVPLHILSLHGIFRFTAPPADLAVDRLLMVAACEGHALHRNAVEALYDARQRDIRACLMDLNYWCQFAVGDRRGALDWFYPRWPRGSDVDEDGNIIRVISQDTYVEGMGWLTHNVLAQETIQGQSEEELLQEAQEFWQIDVGDWNESLDLAFWATTVDPTRSRLETLEQYENYTDAMSIADLCSAMTFTASGEEPIDCTLPNITNKTRDDYVLGRQLLDAPVASTFDPLITSLPINLKYLSLRTLQHPIHGPSSPVLDGPSEASVISKIRQTAIKSFTGAPLTRDDFSDAFDILAASDKPPAASGYLDPSIFDGTLRHIAVDVAPYIRGIVAYESELQKQRLKLSNLLSQGGTKRTRNTRASHAALEGGSRSTTRAERWFKSELNGMLVMRTAGNGWADALKGTGSVAGSVSAAKTVRGRKMVIDDGEDDEAGGSSGMDAD